MTPRLSLAIYVVAVHGLLVAAALQLSRESAFGWLAVELVIIGAAIGARKLWRTFAAPLARVEQAAQLLEEGDLSSRLAEAGRGPEELRFARAFNRAAGAIKDARVALEARTCFFEKVVAASPGGVVVLGFDGEIVEINATAERLLGVSSVVAQGRPPAALGTAIGEAIDGVPVGAAQVVALAGGRRVKVQKGELHDRGFARQFVLLEELTEELRRIEKAAFEKVVRLMSHEVNNSLGASRSLLESCLAYAPQLTADDRRDFEEAIGVVVSRARELGQFMEGIAEVVRVPPPRRHATSIAEVVDAVMVLMRAEAEQRRITLRWRRRDQLVPVAIDRAQIEQVLVNVIKNAFEAIRTDGSVTMELEAAAAGTGRLVIEDSGPGLTDAQRARLHSPFFTTKDRGHGVGLAIVREILTQHGFAFDLEAPVGGPTRFSIELGRGDTR